MRIVLFTGAGASVELGVPAMRPMAVQFREHLDEVKLGPELVQRLAERFADPDFDVEHLIEELDGLDRGIKAFGTIGVEIDDQASMEAGRVRSEAEWFVQHVCERVQATSATTLWRPTLTGLSGHDITIATTNYDRAIEIAASRAGVAVDDGFEPFGGKEWAPWRGFGGASSLRVMKLHGSTDWYHSLDHERVIKLRHAMALYGSVTLTVDDPDAPKLASAVVLPSREKIKSNVPYTDIWQAFRNDLDSTELAVFVGTSLRDPDLRRCCSLASERVPTFVVGRRETPPDVLPEKVAYIAETAGVFLASTLPAAFACEDPASSLLDAASRKRKAPRVQLVAWLETSSDESRDTRDRIAAIESMADAGVGLGEAQVRPLLEAEDEMVALYSLALIQESRDRDLLLSVAKDRALKEKDSVFASEVGILTQLIEPSEPRT